MREEERLFTASTRGGRGGLDVLDISEGRKEGSSSSTVGTGTRDEGEEEEEESEESREEDATVASFASADMTLTFERAHSTNSEYDIALLLSASFLRIASSARSSKREIGGSSLSKPPVSTSIPQTDDWSIMASSVMDRLAFRLKSYSSNANLAFSSNVPLVRAKRMLAKSWCAWVRQRGDKRGDEGEASPAD